MSAGSSTIPSGERSERGVSGPVLWFALTAGILAWMAHITALAALTEWVCDHGGTWVLHVITAGLAAVTAVALLVSGRFVRRWSGEGEPHRRSRFLGRLAAIQNAFSLALIVAEGLYVVFVDPCT